MTNNNQDKVRFSYATISLLIRSRLIRLQFEKVFSAWKRKTFLLIEEGKQIARKVLFRRFEMRNYSREHCWDSAHTFELTFWLSSTLPPSCYESLTRSFFPSTLFFKSILTQNLGSIYLRCLFSEECVRWFIFTLVWSFSPGTSSNSERPRGSNWPIQTFDFFQAWKFELWLSFEILFQPRHRS